MDSTVFLFHEDLTNFSTRDLYTLARYYGLEAPLDDLRWLIAIRHAEQKAQMVPGQLTGDPYLNIEIIKHLDDESLDRMCQEYPDLAWSCEEVWKERVKTIESGVAPAAGQTWRQVYEPIRALKRLQEWLRGFGKKYTLKKLGALRELRITKTKATEIPRKIGQLSNLRKLVLNWNRFTEIPREIGQLGKLQELYLSGNRLTEIPNQIGQLTNLRKLFLASNRLTEIPREIGQLGNLKTLNLSHNQLAEIPREIGQLGNLKTLDLAINPLAEKMPKAIYYAGRKATQQALDTIKQAAKN